jgi:renal tumor antigen
LTDGYYNYKMDMWGVGCVFFEIVSLFPLFPGTNEMDQIQKIHNVVGTPPPDLLAKMKRRSQHMDFNFPPKVRLLSVTLRPSRLSPLLNITHGSSS